MRKIFDRELRFARGPRNYFAVVKLLFPIRSNFEYFGVFHHLWTSLDMFETYAIVSNRIMVLWQVWTCLDMFVESYHNIMTSLNMSGHV